MQLTPAINSALAPFSRTLYLHHPERAHLLRILGKLESHDDRDTHSFSLIPCPRPSHPLGKHYSNASLNRVSQMGRDLHLNPNSPFEQHADLRVCMRRQHQPILLVIFIAQNLLRAIKNDACEGVRNVRRRPQPKLHVTVISLNPFRVMKRDVCVGFEHHNIRRRPWDTMHVTFIALTPFRRMKGD